MKTDPLIRAAKKAYRSSSVGKLDKLIKEQAFWKRRETIARNKLAEVRDQIDAFGKALAQDRVSKGEHDPLPS